MAYIAKLKEKSHTVEIEEIGASIYRVAVDGNGFLVDGRQTAASNYSLIINDRSFEVDVDVVEDEYRVVVDGRSYFIHLVDERRMRFKGLAPGGPIGGRQEISVPMPGKVIAVLVSRGEKVERDQGLIIVEAMKMENEVRSPAAGTVKEIRVKAGKTVDAGAVLVVIE